MTTRAIEWMERMTELAGADATLAGLLLKATLLVLLGAVAVRLLARAGAAARHLAWTLTILGLLALPALVAWAPALDLPVLPGGARMAPAATSDDSPSRAEAGGRALDSAPDEAVISFGSPAGVESVRPSPGLGLALAWALGSVACLLYLAVGIGRVAWLGRRSEPIDGDRRWHDQLASLRSLLGVGRPVSVRLSDDVAVPLAYGLRRPVVLLPSKARAWDDGQRRDVLMHELAHLARADWPVQVAARAVCALYWFHPLVWWSVRRLTLEAERACDDRVLLAGSDSCDYAGRLLRIAAGSRGLADPSYAAVAMARRSDLATRIESILDGRVRRHGLRTLPALLVAASLLVPLAILGSARLSYAEPAGDAARTPERADRAIRGVDKPTPLLAAVWNRDHDAVRSLLAGGADPDVSVDGDGTPLIAAVRSGDEEMARLLLDGGADPDLWASGDGSPLFHAAVSGDEEMARLLLDAGADPAIEVPGDGNALIVAAREGHLGVVDLLVRSGVDVDRVVPGDENPLIRAAGGGHLEVVRYLLDAGADPNARVVIPPDPFHPDGDVRTPLSMARRGGHDDVVRLLRSRGARQ